MKASIVALPARPIIALRDYGLDAQIGREDTPEQYIDRLVAVFHELKRVLRPDGTFWLNIADTYCGTGSKGGYTDPKNPKGRNGQSLSLNPELQAKGFNRYSVAVGVCPASGRVVFTQRHHLAERKPHARKLQRPSEPLL